MLGVFLALLSSFFWGTNDYLNKRLLLKGLDENFVLWVRFPIAFLLLTPLGLYHWDLSMEVVLYALLWLPLEILGGVFFIRGLKYASLSVAMHFYSLVPLFSALSGWLFLSERPSVQGFSGMLLVVFASLLLVGLSPKEFFKRNRGAVYMLLSALFFGFNVVLGKASILESNSFFFSWFYSLCMSLGTLVFVKPRLLTEFKNYKHWEVPAVGLFFAIGDLLYNLALYYTLSSYVASVERFSLIVALIYGRLFLGESSRNLWLPASLMVLGNALLSFG